MPLSIVRNDITKMKVNAIVNAANTSLRAGGGVCGAIFNAAGADKLQKACNKLAPIETGEAVITKGYALPAKYIIHTAGPVYRDGEHDEEALLRACYINSLNLAYKNRCKSIAFPLISSGIYGYPKEEALSVATSSIKEWLVEKDMDVSLVVFDKAAFSISKELLGDVRAFIDETYVDARKKREGHREFRLRQEAEFDTKNLAAKSISLFEEDSSDEADYSSAIPDVEDSATHDLFETTVLPDMESEAIHVREAPSKTYQSSILMSSVQYQKDELDSVLGSLDEPFSITLLRLIDAKGRTDVEVYKRANLDRKLFSKIRTAKGYMPSKKTVVALAIALELSLPEARNLMERAGFALSRSVVFDVIIEYFITHRKYDIFEINNVLFEYDQPILGG